MVSRLVFVLFVCSISGILAQEPPDVMVIVRSSELIGETNDAFVCATVDWWPKEKCNYNQCPWGQASALNLDLHHPFLANAIQAFKPLRIRVGGSLQDELVYAVGHLENAPCKPFTVTANGLFGFSKGCLSMGRWDELNYLFQKTGAIVTFGLNALRGRHPIRNNIWGGPWNSSNARDFIEYTISKRYPVDSWEFGNELSGHGVGASVDPQLYGNDVIHLKRILDQLYESSSSKPLLVAPGGFFDPQWYSQFLQASGPNVVNAISQHIYNLGAGSDPNIKNRITDPKYLSNFADTFRNVNLTLQRHGSWASAWVSEAGGAYNSGSPIVSKSFLNSLWYLDQLGMASQYNTKVYCRQSLVGGNYALLDSDSFIPNPDYYSALLWHRIMGKGVLSIDLSGSPYLRAYAHCRKTKGGIAILLINLSKTTQFSVSVRNNINANLASGGGIHRGSSFERGLKRTVSWVGRKASDGSETREEYHLTAMDGNHLGRTSLLNGNPLQLTEDGNIPALNPVLVPVNSPISVEPLSIAFVVFPNFEAKACV